MGSEARFSKVPKPFGCISGDIILFVSWKRRGPRGTKLCSYFNCYSLYNIWQKPAFRVSGSEFYERLFWPEKFSGLSRNGPLACVSQKTQKLYGPEKPFVKLRPACSVKLVFLCVVKGIKIKITAKFCDTEHFRFEDTKRIMSPEKFRVFQKTGPWAFGRLRRPGNEIGEA